MNSTSLKMENNAQQEMCRLFSSEFQDVDVMELQPFLAVMRMLKLEYGKSNNALYRLLITILQEYDPNLGEDHREKTVKYLHVLLNDSPEIADYLQAVLPPAMSSETGEVSHALHSRKIVTRSSISTNFNRRNNHEHMEIDLTNAKKTKHETDATTQFYNYTSPAVSAYLESRGIPARVTTMTSSTDTYISPSFMKGTTNDKDVPISQFRTIPLRRNVTASQTRIRSALHPTSSKTPLPRILINPRMSQGSTHISLDLSQKIIHPGKRITLVPKSISLSPVVATTTNTSWKCNSNKCTAQATLSTSCSTVSSEPTSHMQTYIQPSCQKGNFHKNKGIEKNRPVKIRPRIFKPSLAKEELYQSIINENRPENSEVESVRNLTSFPYAQQMTIVNGITQNIILKSGQNSIVPLTESNAYISCNNSIDPIKHPLVYLQHMADNPTLGNCRRLIPAESLDSDPTNVRDDDEQAEGDIVVITDEEENASGGNETVEGKSMDDDLLLLSQLDGVPKMEFPTNQ